MKSEKFEDLPLEQQIILLVGYAAKVTNKNGDGSFSVDDAYFVGSHNFDADEVRKIRKELKEDFLKCEQFLNEPWIFKRGFSINN